MNCEEFEKRIYDYLVDGNIDSKTKNAMEEHYFECDHCFDMLELFSTMIGVLKNEGVEKLLKFSKKDVKNFINTNVKRIADKLKQFVSDVSFPVRTYSYYGVRGEVSTENLYTIGEKIVISLKVPSDKSGYLTVLHYNDDNVIKLIFPNDTSMEKKAFKPNEEIRIGVETSPPVGTHFLKAFLTKRKIFKYNFSGFDRELYLLLALNNFFDNLSSIDKEEWIESVCTFEVV